MKRVSVNSGTTHQHPYYRGARRRREREGDRKNIPRDNSQKLPSHGKGTTHSNPGSTMSSCNKRIKNKPEKEHPETHINQTDQN